MDKEPRFLQLSEIFILQSKLYLQLLTEHGWLVVRKKFIFIEISMAFDVIVSPFDVVVRVRMCIQTRA